MLTIIYIINFYFLKIIKMTLYCCLIENKIMPNKFRQNKIKRMGAI